MGGGANEIVRSVNVRNRVLRAAETGRLTFVYELAYSNPAGDIEVASLSARGFGGFTTDIRADVDRPTYVERSADGGQIYAGTEPGSSWGWARLDRAVLIIDTDATAFDAGGELGVRAIELLTAFKFDEQGNVVEAEQDTFGARTTFSGLYQPSAAVAVPLPPGAWAGLATLAGTGALGAFRRRRRS